MFTMVDDCNTAALARHLSIEEQRERSWEYIDGRVSADFAHIMNGRELVDALACYLQHPLAHVQEWSGFDGYTGELGGVEYIDQALRDIGRDIQEIVDDLVHDQQLPQKAEWERMFS